ncbi:alpha/beta hydrolase fold domain-containing protein [Phthorimaea operculella]|nr:alpha/beta hydrolase fold domain-containing protein [Phthorimaea operculella]
MFRYLRTCILALVILSCVRAKTPFSNIRNVKRGFLSDLLNTSAVQKGVNFAGEAFADILGPLSSFAVAVAHIFGTDQETPISTANNKNIIDAGYSSEGFVYGFQSEDARMSIEDLIRKYGYPVERHRVTTEDGYELAMFRIPSKGLPVFLMHGLAGSAAHFVVSGPENGLAYLLAQQGFDVWMGNARGNTFSRQHISMKPSEAQFWDFSWHEIGYYDLPAMIDYVLENTSQKTLRYIGHSQGTTAFFVMASDRPEYDKKIEIMIALSPVAYLAHVRSPLIKLVAAGTDFVHAIVKITGIYEFTADTRLSHILKAFVCSAKPSFTLMCHIPLLLGMGVSVAHTNVTDLEVLMGHTPSGSSHKQYVHFGQEIVSGKFRKFNYGSENNLKRYGSVEPPDYKIENIVAPVVLFYGPGDWLAQPEDVEKLASRLPNVVVSYNIPMLNHMEFLIATDFRTVIFPKILYWLTQLR